ncbi:hypothetical protein ES332_A06G098400v1 [Gossypium tomentosum]|uniref:TTF-type domain-containing protein n=1 Tax=Gossypium tomentosum TaxID=34277 RepID=A0A5D2Q455_GOSTO|nr:hypothetical protein ES332_A06G098400v1 [Gossypium tomentosum]
MKSKIIDSFFKKKSTETTQSASEASQIQVPPSSFVPLNSDACPSKIPRVEDEALDLSNLEREPGLRKQIYEAYIKAGPYQHILSEYPASNLKKHPRYFQPSWFKQLSWLEYSPSKDAVFCLPCFLFNSNPTSRFGSTAFTHNGFSNWKKVHDGCNYLIYQAQNIEVSLDGQTIQQISANRLRLKTSIDVVRWLSFQGCAFRGHNESPGSKNRGKFLELLSLLASFDEKIHVKDTASLTLKNVIFNVLLQHSFDIQNIRGQGYDGASNMRGEFNGLQALVLNDSLVAAAREVVKVHQFFKDLSDIVNIASASSKRHDELQKAQAAKIFRLRGDAHNAYNRLRSFEFIFILHVMKEVLGITDNLCQSVQRRSQDILNAMSLVLTTKDLIQKLRDDGWNELLKNVISFCETSDPNKKEDVTVEHHYRVDIVFATIDTQLQELKSRFNENVVELFTLTTALDPKEFFKLFDIDKICILVNKFYLEDFSQQEKERLPYELKHYELDVCKHSDLRKISTLSELCRSLVESGKSFMYPFVDRLICLILTIPVSIASSEHAFSAMKIVKNRLRSKMEDDFLRSSLVMYIEKEIAEKFDINEIIDDFSKVKDRRVQFK